MEKKFANPFFIRESYLYYYCDEKLALQPRESKEFTTRRRVYVSGSIDGSRDDNITKHCVKQKASRELDFLYCIVSLSSGFVMSGKIDGALKTKKTSF